MAAVAPNAAEPAIAATTKIPCWTAALTNNPIKNNKIGIAKLFQRNAKKWNIVNNGIPINCTIWRIIAKIKYIKSKFLNPSFTGNLLIVLSQSELSISLIPMKFPLPPFLNSSINPATV